METKNVLNLDAYESGTKELWEGFKLSCREIEKAMADKKPFSDKTKLATVVIGGFAKLKGAEVHRMAMEIMLTKLITSGPKKIAQ